MFYNLCRILNIALGLLFITISIFALLTLDDSSPEGMVVSTVLLFINLILLVFSLICSKIYLHNNQQKLIPKKLILSGKVLFALNLLCALGVFVCAIAAVSSVTIATYKSMQKQLPFYILFILLLILSGVTSVVNLFFFVKALQKNKIIIGHFINNIGS
jgi:drug/metabolite transporter (DMT)-like permease